MGHLRYQAHLVTGNATGVGVGSQVNGNALFIGASARAVEGVSSVVTALAETSTLTLTPKWQVGNTSSAWFDVAGEPQNPANVTLGTGTTGADTAVLKALPVPSAVYGYKFARMSLVVGGDTGTTNDTYSISYSYRHLDQGESTDGHVVFNGHLVSGNATGVAPGSQVNGASLFMGKTDQKVSFASALVTVDGETNTLTLSAKWQGSNDASSWVDLAYAPQNPAAVPLCTGTSGADASVVRVIPAPDAAYGYQFARCSIVVGVVTGTTNDTYSIAYCYRQIDSGGRRE